MTSAVAGQLGLFGAPPAPGPARGPAAPFDRGMAGSARAARRWTDGERELVDVAIERVAETRETFTADAVWTFLDGAVPVTKGLAGRLNAAARRGLIESTGDIRIAQRGGAHDHGQRLTVWRSLTTPRRAA